MIEFNSISYHKRELLSSSVKKATGIPSWIKTNPIPTYEPLCSMANTFSMSGKEMISASNTFPFTTWKPFQLLESKKISNVTSYNLLWEQLKCWSWVWTTNRTSPIHGINFRRFHIPLLNPLITNQKLC